MGFLDKIFKRGRKDETVDQTAIDSHMVMDGDARGMPSDAVFNVIGEKSVLVTISILFSYIRYYLNTGKSGTITLKVGYNKPPSIPFSFTVNDQLLDDIYPGDTLEIN